jgi:hypothetical protein
MLLPLLESVSVGPKLVIQTSTCLGVFDETSRQWDHMPIVGHPKSMLIGCDFDAGDITCKYLVRSALFFFAFFGVGCLARSGSGCSKRVYELQERMQPNLKVDGTTSNMSPEDATIQHIMQLIYVARCFGSDTEVVMFLLLLFEKLEAFNRRDQMEECFLGVQDGFVSLDFGEMSKLVR